MRVRRFSVIGVIFILLMMVWIPRISYSASKDHTLCQTAGYSCIKVKKGESWQTLFPDEGERGIVMRVNRTNGSLYPGKVVVIPDNLSYSDLLDHSPFPMWIEAPQEKLIVFDPKKNAWGAYDADGELVRWGPATGGSHWCEDIGSSCRTKQGSFRIYSLGSSNCVSSKFPLPKGGAPMPYCMFFNVWQAFHGSPGGVIRGNESHGCVRLFVDDAEWLRYDFVDPPRGSNNYRGTKIVVFGS